MNEAHFPGEAITSNKPHLRSVGSTVVRYVRPWIQGVAAQQLGLVESHSTPLTTEHLGEIKRVLGAELDALREHGVIVPEAQIDIAEEAPFTDEETGKIQGVQEGLTVTTEFVKGEPIKNLASFVHGSFVQNQEAAIRTFSGLGSYILQRYQTLRPFMCDVFDMKQYVLNEQGLVLVDLDPLVAAPNDYRVHDALQKINRAERSFERYGASLTP